MDWDQTPKGVKGKADVAVWHDLVEARKASTSSEVLPVDKESKVGPISTFWRTEDGTAQRVDYTSEVCKLLLPIEDIIDALQNMVAAVAGLMSALPRNQRIGPEDVVLPITPLLFSYPLALTLAALFSNATVALNSATAGKVDFALATANISPTIIIASSRTISAYHDKFMSSQTGIVAKTSRFFQGQRLQAGNMPSPNPMFKLASLDSKSDLSKLRLLLIFHRAGDSTSVKLSSALLSDLRMVLGTRVCYALTAAKVAGAVCQTNALDYRQYSGAAHFGPPLTCVEIHLTGSEKAVQRSEPQGQVSSRASIRIGSWVLTIYRLWSEAQLYVAERQRWTCQPSSERTIHCRCCETDGYGTGTSVECFMPRLRSFFWNGFARSSGVVDDIDPKLHIRSVLMAMDDCVAWNRMTLRELEMARKDFGFCEEA